MTPIDWQPAQLRSAPTSRKPWYGPRRDISSRRSDIILRAQSFQWGACCARCVSLHAAKLQLQEEKGSISVSLEAVACVLCCAVLSAQHVECMGHAAQSRGEPADSYSCALQSRLTTIIEDASGRHSSARSGSRIGSLTGRMNSITLNPKPVSAR